MWWSDEKMEFYIQAAVNSDFHKEIADLITPYIAKENKIHELGCGLGFLVNELTNRGYEITGIDDDKNAIEKAEQLFPACHFSLHDAYSTAEAEISIAMFFGRIMQDDNFEKLISSCRKRLIYIANEHNRSENPDFKKSKEIASFLEMQNVNFKYSTHKLSFNQVCRSKAEAEDFLLLTYKDKEKIDIIRSTDDAFPYLIPINKAFGLFVIDKEEKK